MQSLQSVQNLPEVIHCYAFAEGLASSQPCREGAAICMLFGENVYPFCMCRSTFSLYNVNPYHIEINGLLRNVLRNGLALVA